MNVVEASPNRELLDRAYQALPGASLGTFFLPSDREFVVAKGEGAFVTDVQGRRYLDFIMGSGPMILGHAHPAVIGALINQVQKGNSYYALNEPSIELAEKMVRAIPCAEAVKFCSTGSEATFYALRLARAFTGRTKIVKFEGGYHGHHDYTMISTWPVRDLPYPQGEPDSAGIPQAAQDTVLIAPFNDLATTTALVEAEADNIAAVIVEPETRLITPEVGFLEGLRALTRRLGIVLIFDEMVTGFRVAYGGAQSLYSVVPDLATYGKIIGGGLPLAAIAGARNLLELSNPRRQKNGQSTYISGTLAGLPLAAAAGLAVLNELSKPGTYDRLNALGVRFRQGLEKAAKRHGVQAQVLGTGPMANIYFTDTPIRDYRTMRTENEPLKRNLRSYLLDNGVMTHLGAKMYVSLAHSEANLEQTVDLIDGFIGKSNL